MSDTLDSIIDAHLLEGLDLRPEAVRPAALRAALAEEEIEAVCMILGCARADMLEAIEDLKAAPNSIVPNPAAGGKAVAIAAEIEKVIEGLRDQIDDLLANLLASEEVKP